MPPQQFDLAIVGGGLVGASLAVALARLPLRIALIEAASPPATAPAWDERCIALNDGSRRIFEGMGVWQSLAPQAAPITATHISERGKFGVSRFTAEQAGLAALGHNTPLRAIGAALMGWMQVQGNLTLLAPARLASLQMGAERVALQLDNDQQLSAKLVIAADGAHSAVRQLLGLPAEVRDYAQSAIVTAITTQRSNEGVAYERFMPTGPLALLPKPRLPGDARSGHIASLVWTLPTEEAARLQAAGDADFLREVHSAFGERLGAFLSVGQRISWPLARTVNEQPQAPRIVFCGNAAQSLHPVAAQGFNLGLRDVAALAASLGEAATEGSDPGAVARLSAYTAARQQDRRRTADFTDQLVRTFSNSLPLVSQLRHCGLLALDLAPPLREAVLRQNLGHRGLSA